MRVRKKYTKMVSILITLLLALCACEQNTVQKSANEGETNESLAGSDNTDSTQAPDSDVTDESSTAGEEVQETETAELQKPDRSELFSDRDFETAYSEKDSTMIKLNGDTASSSSDGAVVSGSTVTITKEGTYILSGTLNDGMILVETDKKDKVQIVLNGVSIHSETSAPLYVRQSDKVFLTLAADSENILSNGGVFEEIDENHIDAAIYSKEDLTINGSGTLRVTSPAGHGIVSKDSLRVTGGIFEISSASSGLSGKDDVCIADGSFTILSGKDGIHAENTEDETAGFVYLENGTFVIEAEGDGISASSGLWIEDGSYEITSGGGSENAAVPTSQSWGDFKGGGRRGEENKMGDPGAAPESKTPADQVSKKSGDLNTTGSSDAETAVTDEISGEDSTSIKGIKAAGSLGISGGTFHLDTADDAVHSNASVFVAGGTFEIAAGDDAFHADETMTISGGTIEISTSYEGIEGLHVVILGGEITLTAADDGINAAGGTDMSGMAGPRGNEKFGGGMQSGTSGGSILISGGTIYVKASGDGIDANGSLEITGGSVTVCGPSQGDTATLDYDTTAVISGGTFIGTGASGMAQTFSDSAQGVIAVSVGQQSEGTEVTLTDGEGKMLLSCTPELSFAVAILSSPDIVLGQTYTITVGSQSGEVTAK
ncbi:MAG: carbohydrate-binding domain-containing protein [Fusicatenibacter sp.]